TRGGAALQQFAYAYDPAGNRTRKTMTDLVEDYTYDDLSRLVRVSRATQQWLFGYDAVGNRISEQEGDRVRTGAHGNGHRLLSRQSGGPVRVSGALDEPGHVSVNGVDARMLAGNKFEADVVVQPGANTLTVSAHDQSGNARSRSYSVAVEDSAVAYGYDG